jgi:hypothetical protein
VATALILDGMGHDFPPPIIPRMVDAITAHMKLHPI